MFGDRRRIARAMQDADDDQHLFSRQVVDRVRRMEGHTQTRSELLASRADQRCTLEHLKFGIDGQQKARRGRF